MAEFLPVWVMSVSLNMKMDIPTIKLFVSHRIDKDTPNIEQNPLYVPVRCGATFDRRKEAPFQGDNTGINISNKRISYNEFTVQYWAWKNAEADYYGLCHYRRYLSFSSSEYPLEEQTRYVKAECISEETTERFGLSDQIAMRQTIVGYDAIVNRCADVRKMLMNDLHTNSVYAHWALAFGSWSNKPQFREDKYLLFMLDIIRKQFPCYEQAAASYLSGIMHRGYNCYVLRKDLFNQMCDLQFGVMSQVEANFNFESSAVGNDMFRRTPALIGELLFGIFIHYLELQGSYRIKENQLVLFAHTGRSVRTNNIVLQSGQTLSRNSVKNRIKRLLPSFRAAHRLENRLKIMEANERALTKSIQEMRADIRSGHSATGGIDSACAANAIQMVHRQSFKEFKGRNIGKDVVILASGPSLAFYQPIEGVIHIGMNRTLTFPKVKLDYYFLQDWEYGQKHHEYFNQTIALDCVKFFGCYCNPATADRHQMPEELARMAQARRYYSNFPSKITRADIEYYPVMDFGSVVFPAIHFALYTQPRKIYLVGCDVSHEGHFGGTEQTIEEDRPDPIDIWTDGYIRVRDFASKYFPNTEIVSLNPVGLKGIFRDIFSNRSASSEHAYLSGKEGDTR